MIQSGSTLDAYGAITEIKGKQTGFFHIQEIGGRSWLISPLGNAFTAIALSHPYTGETKYIYESIYNGDYAAYISDSFDKLKDLGFNCSLADFSSPERNRNDFIKEKPVIDLFEKHTFPYIVGIYLLKHPLEFEEGETYADIFGDEYRSRIAEEVEVTCSKYRDNPLVIGYYYGFGGLNDEVGLIECLLEKEESSPGRKIILDYFAEKYANNLGTYNSVYGTTAQTAADMYKQEKPKFPMRINNRYHDDNSSGLADDMIEDFEHVVEMIAVHLYRMAYEEIRKYDENHLLFGAYLKTHSLNAQTWKKVSPYIDAISPQHIEERPDIDEFIRVSGLPALVSDERFGIVYPNKIRFAAVESHARRGEIYKMNMECVLGHPKMLGVSYCNTLFDQIDPTSRLAVGEQGIYDSKGKIRPEVSEPIKEANSKAFETARHYGDTADYQEKCRMLFELWVKAQEGVSKDPALQWKPTDMAK